MAALVLPLPREATTEEKTLVQTDAVPYVPLKTKDYSTKQFDRNYSTDTDCEEGTGTSRTGRGHWVTDV